MKLQSFFNALCYSESSHSQRESTEAEGGSTYKAAGWLVGCGSVGVLDPRGCAVWLLVSSGMVGAVKVSVKGLSQQGLSSYRLHTP